ncbi:acyl-CoA dehydrogenase family protein [Jeotgalibaca porci]
MTGGYGFMKDSDIERYIRDAKVTSIYGGSSRSQRRMITEPWVNS